MKRIEVVLLLWFGVLLLLASSPLVVDIRKETVEFFLEHFDMEWQQAHDWHQVVRKALHVPLYAITGFLVGLAVRSRGRGLVVGLAVVLLIAVVDEGVQSLSPGRSGSVFDVLLDGGAGLLGLWLSRRAPRAPTPPSTRDGSSPPAP